MRLSQQPLEAVAAAVAGRTKVPEEGLVPAPQSVAHRFWYHALQRVLFPYSTTWRQPWSGATGPARLHARGFTRAACGQPAGSMTMEPRWGCRAPTILPIPRTSEVAMTLSRRELLGYSALFGPSFLAAQGLLSAEGQQAQTAQTQATQTQPQPAAPDKRRYDMKKSINLWALPYPQKMSLKDCFSLCKEAGFDGVEVNYALEGDLSPQASDADIRRIGEMARGMGLAISGVCSFLFWPYAFTHEDPQRRQRGIELAEKMIHAARLLETDNLLVVPGSVYAPWIPDEPPVPHDVAYERATAAIRTLLPTARRLGVYLNIENIFANGFLHSPQEMNAFVDQFQSDHVCVHFDTGNIMQYHFPEHWIPLLGKRIRNVHLKEYSKKVHEFNLNAFRLLLDGTTNWPAVLAALDQVGYRGYLTFEYFNPFPHWPEAIVFQTADALDRMLGLKG
jgi:hexulose-6-phosphate isomerase